MSNTSDLNEPKIECEDDGRDNEPKHDERKFGARKLHRIEDRPDEGASEITHDPIDLIINPLHGLSICDGQER